MRYAAILGNDCLNATNGFAVSLWTQGCHFHCKGCHNKHVWDFNGGIEEPIEDVTRKIKTLLVANGVQRDFSVLGGEPLCKENLHNVATIIKDIKEEYPDITIHIWTGYTIEELFVREPEERDLIDIFRYTDIIIDGRFDETKKELDLPFRGSTNQRILRRGYDF